MVRTPIGRHAGKLAAVRPDNLAALVLRALVQRNPFPPETYEDVVLGCTNQAGEDCRNVARHAGLLAGLPVEVAGQTINRLCSSGLAAVVTAAHAIRCGEGELFLAGGVESMSRAPIAIAKAETPYSREVKAFDTTLGARFPNPCFIAGFGSDSLAETADNVAREVGVTRSESDAFACESQQRYARAQRNGFYQDELLPVPDPQQERPAAHGGRRRAPAAGDHAGSPGQIASFVRRRSHHRRQRLGDQRRRRRARRGIEASGREVRRPSPGPAWSRRRWPGSRRGSWVWAR